LRLAEAGCQWAHGWLFGPAVPGASLPHLLGRLAEAALRVPPVD
jgi:EAL domain-containing protein (putative c-di-GMP-specific phosphodiesterase class I)